MLSDWYVLFFLIVFMFTHEFGHYWVAKRQGIYKGIGWVHFMGPCVHLTRPFNSRWDYLSGIIFSFLSLPLYLIGIKYGWMGNGQWYHFPLIAIAFGAWDIVILCTVGKTFKVKKAGWFLKGLAKLKWIEITDDEVKNETTTKN